MNILQVVTHGGVGGAQRHVRDLFLGLTNRGHDVSVFSGSAGWLGEQIGAENIHVEPGLSRTWNPVSIQKYSRALANFVEDRSFDLVHFHSSNTMLAALRFPSRVKKVATVHGWSIAHPGWKKMPVKKWIYKSAMSRALNKMKGVIFVCEADKELNKRLNITTSPAYVVYNGITAARGFMSRNQACSVLELDPKKFIVGTIARPSYQKDLELFQKIASGFPGHEYSFINLAGKSSEAHRLLPALDVFMLTSRFEGFPYVLLEAATASVPIVSTNVGGISEFITDEASGLLVHTRKPADFASAIEKLRGDEALRRSLAESAEQRLEECFSEAQMLDKVDGIYASI